LKLEACVCGTAERGKIYIYMDKEPASDEEDEHGRIRDRLKQHPQSNAQVQGSQQQKGSGSRSSTHKQEIQQGDGSRYH